MKRKKYLLGIIVSVIFIGLLVVNNTEAKAGNQNRVMAIDPERAMIAAGIVVIIGAVIFIVRNKETYKRKMEKSYE